MEAHRGLKEEGSEVEVKEKPEEEGIEVEEIHEDEDIQVLQEVEVEEADLKVIESALILTLTKVVAKEKIVILSMFLKIL